MYEKDGKVITQVTPWVTKKAAEKLITDNVDKDAIMVTDAYAMYKHVGKKYYHVVVNHAAGQYVDENKFHTNNIENFWLLYTSSHKPIPKTLARSSM